MLEKFASNLKKCDPADKTWAEIETKLKQNGGYFSAEKSNTLERVAVDLGATTRGRAYRSKAMSCKKDYGFIIIEMDDKESVRFFSEEGCTASIPKENYKQHLHYTKDNRCKPDRGIFISLQPSIEKILFEKKPIQEGIMVIIEFIKREAQFIHGTPFVWLPSDRDFFVPYCYTRGFIHYRDEKIAKSNQNSIRGEHGKSHRADRERQRLERSPERGSRGHRDDRGRHRDDYSRNRDRYDDGYDSRHYDRKESRRNEDRDHNRDSYRSSRDRGGSRDSGERGRSDRVRDSGYPREHNRYSRERDRSPHQRRRHSPSRYNDGFDRENYGDRRHPSYEGREYRNDRNRHDHGGHNSGRSCPPNDSHYDQSHSQRPVSDRRSQDDPRWPNHAVNSRDTRWGQGGTSHGMHHDGQNGRNHHAAQMDQTGYSPIPNNNRKYQEPPVYNPSPSNPPHPHQNNDILHGHGVGSGARRKQTEHTVHPHESSTIPQRTGAQPKPPSKQVIDQKRSQHFNQVAILRRLKMRKKRSQCLWKGTLSFDKFELTADFLGYGCGIAHHIPENKILFNNRIPASVAVDIIRQLNQHVKVFNSTIAIKQQDSLLSGSWTAFPVRFSQNEKRDEILSSAFNGCPILMARSPSSNIRILLLERDKLKTLNKDPKTNSEIVPEGELFYPDMRNPATNSSKHQYVALIHSHLTGHCSIKEMRDFIGFNRTQFFQQPVYNIQPFKLLPQLPRLSQGTAAECVRSLLTAKHNTFSFHGQLAEFWNRYDSINDFVFITDHLTNDERIARMTLTHMVERVFSASRHADLMRLIRKNFPNRLIYIQGVLEDQVRLKDEEIRNKMTKRPITPPPSHSHMVISETLPDVISPKQAYKQDFVTQRAEIPQPTIHEPVPKVRKIETPENEQILLDLEQQKKSTDFALIRTNVPPSDKEEKTKNDFHRQHGKEWRKMKFVNLICWEVKHKGRRLNEIEGSEMAENFVNHLKERKETKLPDWFLKDKIIKRSVDDQGNMVPTISSAKPEVIEDEKGRKDLWATEANKKKIPIIVATHNMLSSKTGKIVRAIPETVIQPPPITFQNPGNFTFRAGELRSQQDRFDATQHNYVRLTASGLKNLRLGISVDDLPPANDASDDENERKGGLNKEAIEKWLIDVNVFLPDGNQPHRFETKLENDRYRRSETVPDPKAGMFIGTEQTD